MLASVPTGVVHPVHDGLMRVAHQAEMWSYWRSACGGDEMPGDGAIEPTRLPRAALPYIVLYAVERPDCIAIRLEGTRIVESLGRSRRGGYVGEEPGTEAHLQRMTWSVAHREPYWVESAMVVERYYEHLYSALVLPFGQDGRVTRLLGVNAFD